MKMKRLGTLPDCSDVLEVMIENGSGMTASIMTYGAVIKNLYVPGENAMTGATAFTAEARATQQRIFI